MEKKHQVKMNIEIKVEIDGGLLTHESTSVTSSLTPTELKQKWFNFYYPTKESSERLVELWVKNNQVLEDKQTTEAL